jgi:hypothetical protein
MRRAFALRATPPHNAEFGRALPPSWPTRGGARDALAFTNRVGALAEEEGHHPALLTEWGRVTVTWWTHLIRGLHRNDFIMAAKTDALAAAGGGGTPAQATR